MTWSVKIKRKVAETYDLKHEILPADQEDSMASLTSCLLRDVEIPENPVALDIGCGIGNSTLELHKKCIKKAHSMVLIYLVKVLA